MLSPKQIREEMNGVVEVPAKIIDQIHQQRLLQIWVPKMYGGLGLRLNQGLKIIFDWSKIDGSMGWMLTLCSGANFFSRNLKPHIAKQLFSNPKTCFGGSGMIGGTADKQSDGTFLINGLWDFATGAPHLSHFTLNAKMIENGNSILDENGCEIIRSFVISKDDAEIIPNWKSMGMKATGTYSFKVENIKVAEDYSFLYDRFYTDDALDHVPFRIFADLTLMVNYLGMASHFSEEAILIRPNLDLHSFDEAVKEILKQILDFANDIEKILESTHEILSEKQVEIHEFCESHLKNISHQILEVYFQLGIRATHTDSAVHQVFRDYFTATQHANFRREFI